MTTFYIASRIENIANVRWLRDQLYAAGWTCTYDWTKHGSVRVDPDKPHTHAALEQVRDIVSRVASAEINGAYDAEVFIMLLPGGRGAHGELGAALVRDENVVLWSPQPDIDYGVTEKTSAFYHHPSVQQRSGTLEELATWLVDEFG